MPINYDKSAAEIYTDLVENSIAEDGSLDIICMKRDSAKIDPLPSWVPDWRYSQMAFPCHPLCLKWVSGQHLRNGLTSTDVLGVSTNGTVGHAEGWKAHGNTTAISTITRGLRPKLTTAGRRIGTVDGIGDYLPFPDGSARPTLFNTLLNWEAIMLQKFGNRRSTTHPKIFN